MYSFRKLTETKSQISTIHTMLYQVGRDDGLAVTCVYLQKGVSSYHVCLVFFFSSGIGSAAIRIFFYNRILEIVNDINKVIEKCIFFQITDRIKKKLC